MVPIAAPLAGAPLMLRRELADGLTVGEGYAPLWQYLASCGIQDHRGDLRAAWTV
jgi:hypothetical protein